MRFSTRPTTHRSSLMTISLLIVIALLGLIQPVAPTTSASWSGQEDQPGAPLVVSMRAERSPSDPSQALVEWITTAPATGQVIYGLAEDQLDRVAASDQGAAAASATHTATMTDLDPDREYYFALVIDGERYDEGGRAFRLPLAAEPTEPPATDTPAPTATAPVTTTLPLGAADPAELEQIAAAPAPPPDKILDLQRTPDLLGTGSLLVKWHTAIEGLGWIAYGSSPETLSQVAYDLRGESEIGNVHWVLLPNLPQGTTYYVIFTDGRRYDDDGRPFTVQRAAQVYLPLIIDEAPNGDGAAAKDTSSAAAEVVDASQISGERIVSNTPVFQFPTSGYAGWWFTGTGANQHNGHDIWTGDPRATNAAERSPQPCGNEVRLPYPGIIKGIYRSDSNGNTWQPTNRGDYRANIVVIEHRDVPGAPANPLYTVYLHMAKGDADNNPLGTCIYDSAWDKKDAQEMLPAGFVFGRQGNLRLAGDFIMHLHFAISSSPRGGPYYDPTPLIGIQPAYGDGLIYDGQTIRGTTEPASETDTVYFHATAGTRATITMAKRNSSLDSYLALYTPDNRRINDPAADDDRAGDLNARIDAIELPQTGFYRIEAKSYNGSSSGGYSLRLDLNGSPSVTCPDGQYKADYFNNPDLSGAPVRSECISRIDFGWGDSGPGGGVNTDNFSVRWSGRVAFQSGPYQLSAETDDGMRVRVNGALILDAWRDQAPTRYTPTFTPNAGTHPVVVEFYERGGGATARVGFQPVQAESCLAQSPHPYGNGYNNTWTLVNPDANATQTRVHFSRIETEAGYDYVYVRDANNNQVNRTDGSYPSGGWSAAVPGRTIKVQLTSDASITAWGFCVDRIETVSGAQPPAAPSNIRAIPADSSRIQLSWQDNATNEAGFRVYDGSTLVANLGANTVSHTITGLAPNSYHCYQVFAYNSVGSSPSSGWGCATTPPATITCPNQYRAEYFNNRDLSGAPALVRCEDWPINQNWGAGGPGGGVNTDNFSARWTGSAALSGGSYTFIARSDDGLRAYIDNALIINSWVDRGATEDRATRTLAAGTYVIKVEYYEAGGDALAQFRWEQGSAPPATEVIIDERSGEFRRSGSYWWDDWTIGYAGHMLWTYVNGGSVSSSGEWHPNLPASGNYEVYAFIPSRNAFTNRAPYTIVYRGGTRAVAINQQNYNDAWVSLGIYPFDAGASGYVRLTDATGEDAASLRKIGFDAVKWVRR